MAKTKQLQIPDSESGYSVSTSGTVHTRYAAHAGNVQRTRTADGARTILDGREGSLCQVCFPETKPDSTSETDAAAPNSSASGTSSGSLGVKAEEGATPSTKTEAAASTSTE